MIGAAPMDAPNPGLASAGHPNVVAHPPLILLGSLAVGWGLWLLVPVTLVGQPPAGIVGAVIALAGVTLAALGAVRFRAAGTNVQTSRPAEALVRSGPYRFSRNPIYVGLVLIHAAVGIGFDDAWTLVLTAVFAAVLHVGVIRREEAYLTARFGQAYRDYCARTRRWL